MKALLMAGGQGTRFWPLSLRSRPKQFLCLAGNRTLLQTTADRLAPLVAPSDLFVVASQPYVAEIRRQLPEIPSANLIVEPAARNTAPCIGWASLAMKRRGAGSDVVAVLPADHVVPDPELFRQSLIQAAKAAAQGWLVVFGVEPTYPATGFGYIERGEPLGEEDPPSLFRVRRFVEKPELDDARRMIAEASFTWNSGVFVWTLDRILEELRRQSPDLAAGLESVPDHPAKAAEAFSLLPSISIDRAVMERTDRAAMIPARFRWSDVGSWKALGEVRSSDEAGFIAEGKVVQVGSRDCIALSSTGRLVALVGAEGLVVVDTPEALLVASKDRSEELKELVEKLRDLGLDEYL